MQNLLAKLFPYQKKAGADLINPHDVIVLDTETSGLNDDAPIHSIAAIRVIKGKMHLAQSLTLFLQAIEAPLAESTKIHGITSRKLKEEGILEKDALTQLRQFIQNKTIVGHHIQFDLTVLNKHFIAHDLEPLPERNYICTAQLTKRIERPEPNMDPSYTLEKVCARWNIPVYARHTAAGDTLSNALLWLKLYSVVLKRKIDLTKKLRAL